MSVAHFNDPTYRGKVGQQANMEEWNAITRITSGTDTAPFGMGQPVQRVAGVDGQIEAWDGTSPVLGVTVYDIAVDDTTGFTEGYSAAVMTAGVIYVAAGGTCVAGEAAGYNSDTDRWGTVSATAAAVGGAEFDTNATAGSIVKLRINRPAAS